MLRVTQSAQSNMSKCGDNLNMCHKMRDIFTHDGVVVSYCEHCKKLERVKIADKKSYSRIFKMDSLQPGGNNLYYKYYGKMNTL